MNKLLISTLLLAGAASTAASAAGDFSPAQLNAWQIYCESELDGDNAYCDCLLKAQVDEIGDEAVRVNLNSMIADNPNSNKSDSAAANKALESISEKDYGNYLMLFELGLDMVSAQCEG